MKLFPTTVAIVVSVACANIATAANPPNFNILSTMEFANTQSLLTHFEQTTLKAPLGVAKWEKQAAIAADNHLRQLVAKSLLQSAQLHGVELHKIHDTGRGAIVARFQQKVDGIPVVGSDFALIMNRDYQLVSTSGHLSLHVPQPSAVQAKSTAGFNVPVEQVLQQAFTELGGRTAAVTKTLSKVGTREGFDLQTKGPIQADYAFAEKIYFATPERLIPAYKVEMQTTREGTSQHRNFAYVYSAEDGQLLFRKNQVQHEKFGYRVFADENGQPWDGPQGKAGHPHPTGIKGQNYQPDLIAPQLVIIQNQEFSRNDPWLDAAATETRGNNVDAYVDQTAGNGFQTGDIRGVVNGVTATGEKKFDYVLNTSIAANADDTQKQAAAVQMFYMINWLHDSFYDAGFNEAAGNAQTNNFGRGGLGNDALLAEAQDQEGFNNANMATPSDGVRPRMQMYLYAFSGDQKLTINTPADVAPINTTAASFGPSRYAPRTADIVLVNDNVVGTSDTATGTVNDGCEAFTNAAALAGKIALIERGLCNFTVKVKSAQTAGAVAVIIYNNRAEEMIPLGGDDDTINIPAVGINQADGIALKDLSVNATVSEPIPSRDSSFDTLTIAHEWGHYITNRMIGDGSGLDNNQGGSMGEGWGDFHALLLTVEANDVTATAAGWDAKWSMGGYSDQGHTANEAYFSGIRGVPYTTDMDPINGNSLTFKHVKTDPEVHGSGTLWATVLWDCYVTLLKNYPFAIAQDRMRDYLVASYAATPVSPTFTEARDALLSVVKASDATDFGRMMQAFARRGMGTGAISPARFDDTHAGVIENFDVELPGKSTLTGVAASYEIPSNATNVSITFNWSVAKGEHVSSAYVVANGVATKAAINVTTAGALSVTANHTAATEGNLQLQIRTCNILGCTDSDAVNTTITKAKASSGGSGGGGGGSMWLSLLGLPLLLLRKSRRKKFQ